MKTGIERKKAADEYRRIFEEAMEGIFQSTVEGRFINVNPALAKMLGYSSPREVIDSITDLGKQMYVDPHDRERVIKMLIENDTVEGFEVQSYRKDGRKFWASLNIHTVRDEKGQILYFQGFSFDITRRKLTEQALLKSEEQFRNLVQNTTAIILRFDLQGRFTFVNKFAQDFFGYSEDELLGKHAVGTIVPERESSGRDLAAMFDQITADPAGFQKNSNENMRKSGERVWVEWTNSGIFDSEGHLCEFLSVGLDITEKKRAEESLKQSENVYRTIFETTGTAMIIVEEDTTISLANHEFERVTGYTEEQIEKGLSWQVLLPEEDRKKALNFHKMRRGGPNTAPTRYEIRFLDSRRELRNAIIAVDVIPGTNKSIASVIDITEQKRAEKKLRSKEQDLKDRTKKVEEANAALRALVRARDEQREEIEMTMYNNIKELVLPYVEKLQSKKIQDRDEIFDILKNNLKHVCSPLTRNLRTLYAELTPREIQVINLIREGRTSKDISVIMGVSIKAVEFHRDNIRRKLGITKKGTNLMSFILSMEVLNKA